MGTGPMDFQPTSDLLGGERGFGLLASILVMLLLSVLGTALLVSGTSDLAASDNYRSAKEAFYAADSGLQQSLIDFVADNTWAPTMVDGTTLPLVAEPQFPTVVSINNQVVNMDMQGGNPVAQFYGFGGAAPIGTATFDREIFLPPTAYRLANGKGSKIWVEMPSRSRGTAGNTDPALQVVQGDARVLVLRISVWDNAIFAGGGQGGNEINGNVQVRGSIHVVGDPNNPTTIDWGGNAMQLNNYIGAANNDNFDADAWRLPPLPTRIIDNEVVETLDAEFRLKHGDVQLSGSVGLGEPNQTPNFQKEQLDGYYVDGQTTLSGTAAVNTDYSGKYDITNVDVEFPMLDDPYVDPKTGTQYPTHRSFLMAKSLLLPYDHIDDTTPAFDASDAIGNRARWNPNTGELLVEGIVRVDGILELGKKGGKSGLNRIEYKGTGTMYATDDINVHWDVVPQGEYLDIQGNNSYNLGFIADDDMSIAGGPGDSWIKLFGAFYAEDSISVEKQTRIAGTLVSTTFDLGQNVPRLFQVPRLAGMLPPGMPGADPLLYVSRAEVANWTHIR